MEVGDLIQHIYLRTETGERVLGLVERKEKNPKNPGTFLYTIDWINLEETQEHMVGFQRFRQLQKPHPIPGNVLEKVNV